MSNKDKNEFPSEEFIFDFLYFGDMSDKNISNFVCQPK